MIHQPFAPFASATLSDVEAAGPPTAPLGFPAPRVPRGEIISVRCASDDMAATTDSPQPAVVQVLRQQCSGENINLSISTSSSTAYLWPGVTIQNTLCGQIVLSEVLQSTKNNHNDILFVRTGLQVAIKVDRRQQVRQLHHGTQAPSENPWKEVAALELLMQDGALESNCNAHDNAIHSNSGIFKSFSTQTQPHNHHVVLLLDAMYDDNNLYMILPYYTGGSLHQFMLHHPRGLPEDEARCLFGQLLEAIYYCHSHGICHRDISTQNLLLAVDSAEGTGANDSSVSAATTAAPVDTRSNHHKPYNLVLIDFGMCIRVPHSYPDDDVTKDATDISAGTMRRLIHSDQHCGKLRFMSPEMYQSSVTDPEDNTHQDAVDGLAVDLWAAAVVLFVLLTGRQPYGKPDARLDSDFYDILDEHYYWGTDDACGDSGTAVPQSCSWGHAVSAAAVDLLHHMLQLDPHQRLSLAQVMEHPWMTTKTVKNRTQLSK